MWNPWKTHWALALVKGIREPHEVKKKFFWPRWEWNPRPPDWIYRYSADWATVRFPPRSKEFFLYLVWFHILTDFKPEFFRRLSAYALREMKILLVFKSNQKLKTPNWYVIIERFSLERWKVIDFALTTLHDWLKKTRATFSYFFIQSEIKLKPTVTLSHSFFRALRQPHVISTPIITKSPSLVLIRLVKLRSEKQNKLKTENWWGRTMSKVPRVVWNHKRCGHRPSSMWKPLSDTPCQCS